MNKTVGVSGYTLCDEKQTNRTTDQTGQQIKQDNRGQQIKQDNRSNRTTDQTGQQIKQVHAFERMTRLIIWFHHTT